MTDAPFPAANRSEAAKRAWITKREAYGETGHALPFRQKFPFSERLIRNVYHDAMTGCWLYDGHTVSGYPVVRFRQKAVLVHRASWEHHFGAIPEGLFVCHRCDTPACCNPDHLFLGTPKENHADMVRKGRATRPTPMPGTSNANALLTEGDIGPICAAYLAGESSPQIAARYGVNPKTIGKILTGASWTHVEVPRPRAGATRNSSRNRPTGVIKWRKNR